MVVGVRMYTSIASLLNLCMGFRGRPDTCIYKYGLTLKYVYENPVFRILVLHNKIPMLIVGGAR